MGRLCHVKLCCWFLPPTNEVCEGYVYTRVCLFHEGEYLCRYPPDRYTPTPAGTPPGQVHPPPPRAVHAGIYGQQVGSSAYVNDESERKAFQTQQVGSTSGQYWNAFFFFKIFGGHMSFHGATNILFWASGDVSSGFLSQRGQPCLHLVEVYLMYVSWDWPLVRHLPTSWWPAWWPVTVLYMHVSAELGYLTKVNCDFRIWYWWRYINFCYVGDLR